MPTQGALYFKFQDFLDFLSFLKNLCQAKYSERKGGEIYFNFNYFQFTIIYISITAHLRVIFLLTSEPQIFLS